MSDLMTRKNPKPSIEVKYRKTKRAERKTA